MFLIHFRVAVNQNRKSDNSTQSHSAATVNLPQVPRDFYLMAFGHRPRGRARRLLVQTLVLLERGGSSSTAESVTC